MSDATYRDMPESDASWKDHPVTIAFANLEGLPIGSEVFSGKKRVYIRPYEKSCRATVNGPQGLCGTVCHDREELAKHFNSVHGHASMKAVCLREDVDDDRYLDFYEHAMRHHEYPGKKMPLGDTNRSEEKQQGQDVDKQTADLGQKDSQDEMDLKAMMNMGEESSPKTTFSGEQQATTEQQRRDADELTAELGQKGSQIEMDLEAMTNMGKTSPNKITLSQEQRSERLKQKHRADQFNAQAGKETRPRAALDHGFAGKGFFSPFAQGSSSANVPLSYNTTNGTFSSSVQTGSFHH